MRGQGRHRFASLRPKNYRGRRRALAHPDTINTFVASVFVGWVGAAVIMATGMVVTLK